MVSKLKPIKHQAPYSTASGTYTTASWAAGTNTAVWTAPSDGLYIVWMTFELQDANAENKNAYKQLQMIGSSERLVHNLLYYDGDTSANGQAIKRTICQPVRATAGQTVIPYVHTPKVGMVFTIKIVAVKIA